MSRDLKSLTGYCKDIDIFMKQGLKKQGKKTTRKAKHESLKHNNTTHALPNGRGFIISCHTDIFP